MLNYLFGEALVAYEMNATDAESRKEIAEDYGMGILGVVLVIPASAVVSALLGWVVWRRLPKA